MKRRIYRLNRPRNAYTKRTAPPEGLPSPFPPYTSSYEGNFGLELIKLGFRVVDRAAFRTNADLWDDPKVVVAQYQPRPKDRAGKVRLWALDFSVPFLKVAAELDGFAGNGSAGGHRTWGGFNRDRDKDRALTLSGWRVLRFGPASLQGLEMLRSVQEFVGLIQAASVGLIEAASVQERKERKNTQDAQ